MKPQSNLHCLALIFAIGALAMSKAMCLTVIAESPNVTVDTRDKVQFSVVAVNGTVTGGGDYLPDSTATLTATSNPGYIFTGWTGDATFTQNPLEILMDGDKAIGATFEQDLADDDGDGLSNHDEIVLYGTDPNNRDEDRRREVGSC